MRIRISYKKEKPLRFTSALDVQRIWERSIRRAGFHITYSQGYHPQPKIQLGLPLPLGFIGDDEKVDIWIDGDQNIDKLSQRIDTKVPVGILITGINIVQDNEKPLVTSISECEYIVSFWDENINLEDIKNNIQSILGMENIFRTKRNGKKHDLRPRILEIKIEESNSSNPQLYIKLVSKQNQMGRADEVLFSMGYKLPDFLVRRIRSI